MECGTPSESEPAWLPQAARLYLAHTEGGCSLRALAKQEGCHPSTVLRQVRRVETRRDDPLIDDALTRLGAQSHLRFPAEEKVPMTTMSRKAPPAADEATVTREARRILRRLGEPGAFLAIARDLEKAAVLREGPDGQTTRIGVMDRAVAEAFALKEWIACRSRGRVTIYDITGSGRSALKRLDAEEEQARQPGMAEAQTPFAEQHRDWETLRGEKAERIRYNRAESPLSILGRRRDKDGKPFLDPDLVAAGERLREDFEIAQMGPRVAQNWERFLTGGDRGAFNGGGGPAEGPAAARDRVAAALRDLGPGLGDVALRCCCFLEGLEQAERRMGWSARSGKIVLRIALQRLKRHYERLGDRGGLIG